MEIEGIVFWPYTLRDGWFVQSESGGDPESTEAKALRIYPAALHKGFFAIAGFPEGEDGYRVFLAPSDNVMSIVQAFQVGKQADYDSDASERAMVQILGAHQKNALLPYFADVAGFKAHFSRPITSDLVEFLEETLTDAEPMLDEDDGTLEKYLCEKKAFIFGGTELPVRFECLYHSIDTGFYRSAKRGQVM